MLTKVKSKRVKAPAGPPPRLQRVSPQDRKRELVEIAYRLIAEKGLEGFRIRQVAAEADIDNGTLHYHFPSKEALIHRHQLSIEATGPPARPALVTTCYPNGALANR